MNRVVLAIVLATLTGWYVRVMYTQFEWFKPVAALTWVGIVSFIAIGAQSGKGK